MPKELDLGLVRGKDATINGENAIQLIDENGLHNYVYENESVRETTEEEKEAELQTIPKPVPNAEADLLSMAVDHEYRLTILELDVN